MNYLSNDNALELTRGRYYPVTVEVTELDGAAHEWPAGAAAAMLVKRNPEDTAPVLTVAGTISTGLAVFKLSSADTAPLAPGQYWYEIKATEDGEALSVVELSPLAILANGSD